MSTKTKQKIKEVTSFATGFIAIMIIYFCTFYTALNITSDLMSVNQKNVSAVANEQ